jgi:hypothetical protein
VLSVSRRRISQLIQGWKRSLQEPAQYSGLDSSAADLPNPQESAFADRPGAYRLVITTPTSEIDPGEDIVLEIYITGYGTIRGPKVLFYPPPGSAMHMSSEGWAGLPMAMFRGLTGSGEVINLGGDEADPARWRDVFADDIDHDTTSSPRLDVSLIQSEAPIRNPPIKFVLGTKKKPSISSTKEGFIGKLDVLWSRVRLRTEVIWAGLRRKPQPLPVRRISPGTHSFQVFLTYFNGSEWKTDVQIVSVSVRNVFERNHYIAWTAGIVGVGLAVISLVVNIGANWDVVLYILGTIWHWFTVLFRLLTPPY